MKYKGIESLIITIGLICWIILLAPRTEKNKPVDKNSIEYITGYNDAMMYVIETRDSLRTIESADHTEMKSLDYYYDVDVNGGISSLKEVEYIQK